MSLGRLAPWLVGWMVTVPTVLLSTATLTIDHDWNGERLDTPHATVTLTAEVTALRIEVDARYHGDPPPGAPPGPTEGLWQFEVVEVFLAGAPGDDGSVAYTEIELGPHGHHLVLRLEGVRKIAQSRLAIDFAARIDAGRWHGVASVPWSLLPHGPLTGNAYAIHGVGTARRHLAAFPVPGPAPDFHQPARFRPLGIEQPRRDVNLR